METFEEVLRKIAEDYRKQAEEVYSDACLTQNTRWNAEGDIIANPSLREEANNLRGISVVLEELGSEIGDYPIIKSPSPLIDFPSHLVDWLEDSSKAIEEYMRDMEREDYTFDGVEDIAVAALLMEAVDSLEDGEYETDFYPELIEEE